MARLKKVRFNSKLGGYIGEIINVDKMIGLRKSVVFAIVALSLTVYILGWPKLLGFMFFVLIWETIRYSTRVFYKMYLKKIGRLWRNG